MADILAIDDEQERLDLCAERLADMGDVVETYSDGLVALNEMGEARPDLLLTRAGAPTAQL